MLSYCSLLKVLLVLRSHLDLRSRGHCDLRQGKFRIIGTAEVGETRPHTRGALAWHGRAGRAGSALHGPPTGHSLDLAAAPWGRGCEAVGSLGPGEPGGRWHGAPSVWRTAGGGAHPSVAAGAVSAESGRWSQPGGHRGRPLLLPSTLPGQLQLLMMRPGKAPDGVTPALDNDPSSPRGNCCGGSRAGPSRLCSRRQSGWPFRSESPRPSGNGMYARSAD